VAKLHVAAHAVPITYQARNGKQHVAIMASGDSYLGDPVKPGRLYVFCLPDSQEAAPGSGRVRNGKGVK
jgi:hypothetical protein